MRPGRGPAPSNVAYVFVFLGSIIICRLYKLTLSDESQVTLQLLSRFLAGPPLLGGPKEF